jgi:glycerol kinase
MLYTLAIDQSTSATKAMLFDERAQPVAHASVAHRQLYPQPGWVEHDAEEILRNTYLAAKRVAAENGVDAAQIASVAITNQRETVVVWDKRTGKPVYNAVVWQCRRGADICRALAEKGLEDTVRRKTGLLLNPYFSASGVQWILEHVPNARAAAAENRLLMGTIDTWLIWNLTRGERHATDYTNASRTLLFNTTSLSWDDELLGMFAIPRSMAPQALPCDAVFGETTLNGLLPAPKPIAGVLGDSHGALVGQMCFAPSMGKATYGTGSSLMVNVGENNLPPPQGLVTSVGFAAQGKVFYAFEGNIHCTGATVKWLVDDLQLLRSSSESEGIAASIADNGGVYLVPAFAGLGAPWWNSEARAIICGMTRGSGKAQVVRAALEAIAYQMKDLVDLIADASGVALTELRVDGAPVKNNFLMQLQADMLGTKINRSEIAEASALGAVLMNGLALGRFKSLDDIAALRKNSDYLERKMPLHLVDKYYAGWKKAVAMIANEKTEGGCFSNCREHE